MPLPAPDRPDDESAGASVPPTPPVCAGCGAAMPLAGPEGGCLRCLFATGSATPGEPDPEDTHLAPPAAVADPFSVGPRTGFGHFEIVLRPDRSPHELGRGSMGVSYLARDTVLHCPVALKVIDARLSAQPDARARFLREARAAAQLRHPNVASVFHYGEEGGQCFYAMEFVEGETLETWVRREGPLPAVLALEVAMQVTRALVAADARGVVHRDLKPSNLMVSRGDHGAGGTEGPVIKVIDFGLAKAVAPAAGQAPDLTRGGFVGTPAFASPEQFAVASGEEGHPERIDTRADIYSLGVTLWYLLTGKVPFVGRSLTEIHDRQVHRPLPLDHLNQARVPAPVVTLLRAMLAPDPAERPQTPRELAGELRRCRERIGGGSSLPGRRRERVALAVGIAALLVAAAALSALFLGRGDNRANSPTTAPPGEMPSATAAAVPERSVAVLPFENLSDDKENAFFADGIQDDVITSLAKVRDLKVIGRASVMGYRGAVGADKLREIGHTLDVRNLLEGSVRRFDDRIIVSARLLDPRDGRQLWGETFDRPLRNVSALQGEMAREIAAQLHATLTPEEHARLERPPTGNADAYALYLRAVSFTRSQSRADTRNAVQLFEQATTLDPGFAVVWAQLGLTRANLYSWEPTEELKTAARAAADEALRLRPDQAEAHRALGACLAINQDLPAALEAFQLAARAAPNDAGAVASIAHVRCRQGLWEEARAGYERAVALSPQEPSRWRHLAECARAQRDWPAVVRAQDRVLALAPDVLDFRLDRALTDFRWKGDLAPVKAVLAAVPPGGDPNGTAAYWRWQVAMDERDFDAAEAALLAFPGDAFGPADPKSFRLGRVYQARGGPGDAARATTCFESARQTLENLLGKSPNNHRAHSYLGLTYACLGWRDPAVGEAQYGMALNPESRNAVEGTGPVLLAALTYARLGEVDAALPLVEHLLAVPTTMMDPQTLRVDPDWDGLRGDPRFAALGERVGVPFPPPRTLGTLARKAP